MIPRHSLVASTRLAWRRVDRLEENRVLRELLGERRLEFNNAQRQRLARAAKPLGKRLLGEVATLAQPC
jgi:hypothetical protein